MTHWNDLRAAHLAPRQDGRDPAVGPSDAGGCVRQIGYRLHRIDKTDVVPTEAADLGTLIHAAYAQMIEALYDPAERAAEVPVKVPGLNRRGTADDVWWTRREVTDLKTVGASRFKSWVNSGGPPASVWDQVAMYGLGAAIQDDTLADGWTITVLAVNRDSGESAQWSRPLDQADAYETAAVLAAVETRAYATYPDNLPRAASTRSGFPCGWCEWATRCWGADVPDRPAANLSEPEKAEARTLAEAYLTAAAAEREASEAKAAARAALVGIHGDLGGVTVTWGAPVDTTTVDAKAAAAALADLGAEVPMKPLRRAGAIDVQRSLP